MIPHLVDFFIKYNDCAIMETDKKMFPIMDSLTPARRSVCLCDISCSTTAAASGSKSASFHPTEADREPVVFSMVDLISQSGPQLPVTNEPRSSACVQWTYCRQSGSWDESVANFRVARRSEVIRMSHAFRLVLTSPTGRKRSADQTSSIAMMETGRHPVPLIASEMRSRLRLLSIPDVFFG